MNRYLKPLIVLFTLIVVLFSLNGNVMGVFNDPETSQDNGVRAYTPRVWAQTSEDDFTTNTTQNDLVASIHPGQVEMSTSPVALGSADSFAVLAGSGITISSGGQTTITGDAGTFPTTTENGFECLTLIGTNHAGDAVTQGAKDDLVNAYDDAAGRAAVTVGTELGETTKTPGVYNSVAGTFQITGALTLDAEGDPNASFIFVMATTLTTFVGSQVIMSGGAKAANVFWVVGSSATIGVGTDMKGTILASESITMNSGAVLEGRALAMNGAVTMDTNTITVPPLSGWLDSSVLDTGIDGGALEMVFWDAYRPAGTSVVILVRASDVPPINSTSGLSGAWMDLSSTSPVSLVGVSGRYVQWRVEMVTANSTVTPVLYEVRIYYRGF